MLTYVAKNIFCSGTSENVRRASKNLDNCPDRHSRKKKILIMHFAFKLQTFYSVTEVPYNMRNRRRMWVILQCTDVSQAAEHSFSQVCDLIVTQVKTLQETETRKHPILQTTQVIERQIPGNQTHKHALHSKNKD